MQKHSIIYTVFVIICFTAFPTLAQELHGKVIGITDGDTLTLMTEDYTKHKIRLAEIDTPEKGQPFGQKSRNALSELAFGKQATVKQVDVDRYGRIVGRVFVQQKDGTLLNVNKTMVSSGDAWVYRDYLEDESLLELEKIARDERRGLWALPEADRMPPWDWRKRGQEDLHKAITKQEAETILMEKRAQELSAPMEQSSGFSCGSKRYCKQMSSCAEAIFYLNNCGLKRLDGDGDGTPCESLC